jgi:hypothetical protein
LFPHLVWHRLDHYSKQKVFAVIGTLADIMCS